VIALEVNVLRVVSIGTGIEWFGLASREAIKEWTGWGATVFGVAQVVGLGLAWPRPERSLEAGLQGVRAGGKHPLASHDHDTRQRSIDARLQARVTKALGGDARELCRWLNWQPRAFRRRQ
jgi:hypothetical protein